MLFSGFYGEQQIFDPTVGSGAVPETHCSWRAWACSTVV